MDVSKDTNDPTQEYRSQPDELGSLPTSRILGPGIKLKDRYLIEKELGQGGFGVVYLARDEELHSKRVVIKVLLEGVVQDAWFKKKFQQEKEALARIDHPGVVGILDAGKMPDGKQFLVMQFVEGQTLASLIQPDGMELDQVARIIKQMGKALTAAHKEGIIHCDLKPENVMVQKAGEEDELTKIIDFGIAKVKDSRVASNESTRVAGTLYYFAPEQIEGRPSASSDIYSMGVLAYIMITGRRPFNPRSGVPHLAVQELIQLQRSGVRLRLKDLRPDLPAAAERAILKALSFDPKDRYPQARDFGNELAQILTHAEEEVQIQSEAQGQTPSQGPILEIAHVLFLDIVAYSRMSMERQAQVTGLLQELVRTTPQFQAAQINKRVVSLPTGDGMALVFFGDPIAPVRCAEEVSRALKEQPHLSVRMGINSGPVYHVTDINTNFNIVGGGINVAQRVMDCGNGGHILVSKVTADVLKQLDGFSELVHDLGECEVKHGERIHLYNLYSDEIGNPEPPNKLKRELPNKLKKDSGLGQKRAIAMAASLATIVIAAFLVWMVVESNIGKTGQELAFGLSIEAQKFDYPRNPTTPVGPVVPLFDKIDAKGEINFRFEVGDGLRMNIGTIQPGHLYILNDAMDVNVIILFPAPAFNNGSASLPANQELSLPDAKRWYRTRQSGYEKFWVVWSAQPVGELEELIQSGKTTGTSVTYDSRQINRAREFLTKHSTANPKIDLDPANERLKISVKGDVLAVSLSKR